ncbi:hypothetical protein [Roseateles sp. LYH14W]|uniref:Uncharacterized protein n=1 Tax=Pelomonas parva TaxID=3299032 RepID=A0ABW7F2P2_9BURK
MKRRHLDIVRFGVVACAIALAWAWLHSLGSSLCANTVLSELPSPSCLLRAALLESNCGATTGFSRHVQILRASETPQDDSAFVMDDNHGAASLDVQLRWDDDARVVVSHDAQARVFRAEPSARGVSMGYEARR